MIKAGHRRALIAAMLLATVALSICGIGGSRAGAATGRGPASIAAVQSWTRTLEPVTLHGAALADLDGAPLDELYVYSYRSGAWEQVPRQFDEVDESGAYTVVNGLLDAVDELSFMASDLGEQAAPDAWIDDPASQGYPRYEVWVTNPLNPAEEGWVYLYRSPNLVPEFSDYVQWDGVQYRVEAGTYALGFEPEIMAGIASLELNGTAVDVLDRMKIRVEATCWIWGMPFSVTLNEEDLVEYFSLLPSIDGAIRVGGGTTSSAVWFYRSTYTTRALSDLSDLEPPDYCTALTIDGLRESTDWLNPAASGMAPATYYDANTPAGVAVDGVPDAVPSLPLIGWSQVSGGRGSVVTAIDVSLGDGTISNYYLDDSAMNGDDTGDQRSYGDAGFSVEDPGGLIDVDSASYVLDAFQPNLGDLYRSYHSNPLEAGTAVQLWQPACEPVSGADFAWAPADPVEGEPVTLTATASGTQPIGFAWDLGDGTAADGPTVTHTYLAPGPYTVALTAANACGQQVVGKVISVGQKYWLFLPQVLYNAP